MIDREIVLMMTSMELVLIMYEIQLREGRELGWNVV